MSLGVVIQGDVSLFWNWLHIFQNDKRKILFVTWLFSDHSSPLVRFRSVRRMWLTSGCIKCA